ncbi:MAG TPA: SDR family oxidoreductase [Stellaceae bacterium]|nr:SDR family oxidoreductase [Stellaceae bacterium]
MSGAASPDGRRKVLLVTGGSRGIGAAVCRKAAGGGYAIAVNYARDVAAATALVAELHAAGASAEAFQADMARADQVDGLFQAVDRRFGRVTHLVNNAGVTGRSGRLDASAPEAIAAVIDLNVTGAILAARAAVLRMSTRHGGQGGVIVNLSSAAATLGGPGEFVWYAASKGAIDSFTIGLSREVGAEGIRVNAVSPGLIDTEIHAAAGEPGRVARMAPMIPMARAGSADEVADSILFLLSDAAAYVSGAILRVAGGR